MSYYWKFFPEYVHFYYRSLGNKKCIANIQRQYTIEYLEKVDEKELKYKFSFKNFISIFVAALLVVASILLPIKQITPDAGITTPPVVEDDLKVVVSYYNSEELIIDIFRSIFSLKNTIYALDVQSCVLRAYREEII